MPDKFEIEVGFFENDLTVSGETESDDTSEDEPNDEDLEEYESEYDEDAEPEAEEKENDEAETERIGSVTFKGTKEEIQKGVENLEIAEQYEKNNVKVESGAIIKTPFKTFLLFDTTISNVKYSQINNGESGDPSAYRINIEDSNNQETDINESQEVKIENEDGTTDNIEDSDNLVARVKTRIALKTNESKELKIQPNYYINPVDSTDTSSENIGEGFQIEI